MIESTLYKQLEKFFAAYCATHNISIKESFDHDQRTAFQLVIDVSDAVPAAPGTRFQFYHVPVDLVMMTDRNDDPERVVLRAGIDHVRDCIRRQPLPELLTSPALKVDGVTIAPDQGGPAVEDNYNILAYKAIFHVTTK